MLQGRTVGEVGTPIAEKARVLLWTLAVLDVMVAAWMIPAGESLDRASMVGSVLTLGGNHVVVLALAVAGLVTLVVMTVLTRALTVARRSHLLFLVAGAVASVLALGGVLAVTVVIVGGLLLVAVVGGALTGRHVVFHGGPFRRR